MNKHIATLLLCAGIFITNVQAQQIVGYEYWMDEDFTSRTTVNDASTDITLEIDASSLKQGMHYLNFRAKDSEGKYSAVITQYFYKPRATDGGPFVRYAVQFDDMKADTVEIEATTSITWTDKWLDVPTDDTLRTLDNVTNVARYNHEGIINPEDIDKIWLKVTAEDERTMKLSFGNEGGGWLTTRDTFTHVSEHTLKAAPIHANYVYRMNEGEGTFAKYIRAKMGTLGLKSDRPCALSIYSDTERVTTLTADSVAKGAFINIPEDGVYYFVMQNQADLTRPQSELKLICVNAPLPSPLHVADAGTLADLFTFTDENSVESLSLTGKIDGSDFHKMEKMKNMRTLNLKDVRVVRNTEETDRLTRNDTIHSQAFMAMTNLEELDLPSSTRHVSDGAFEGTGDNLLVVNWNSASADIRSESFDADMGNSLIFAPAGTKVSYDGNVVVGGMAEHIELTDERPMRNPKDFKAKSIRYTRHFDKETAPKQPGGWETLVLPFDVQTIWSEKKDNELAPFNSGKEGTRPFWLAQLTPQGFTHTTAIKANTPYIIAMPNSEAYDEEFNITGDVTFTAQHNDGVPIKKTSEARRIEGDEFCLTPVYEPMASADSIYLINHEMYEGNAPGSLFVKELREAYPFEAYANTLPVYQGGVRSYFRIGNGRDQAAGIERLYGSMASELSVQSKDGILYISAPRTMNVGLYSADGRMVRLLELEAGVNEIQNLSFGVYFVENIKIIIR